MPKSKARKNVDENFKMAAVQRLQTGGVPANDLAKETWRQYLVVAQVVQTIS